MNEPASVRIVSSVTDDEFGGFRITIPPLYHWRGWSAAFLLSSAVLAIALGSRNLSLAFGSLVAALVAARGLINAVAARRIIMIDGKSLAIRTELAGLSRTKTFELVRVRNLRPFVKSQFRGSPDGTPLANSVTFEYGGRYHYFGTGLSEEEILRIVKTIRDRFRIRDHVDDVEPLPVIR